VDELVLGGGLVAADYVPAPEVGEDALLLLRLPVVAPVPEVAQADVLGMALLVFVLKLGLDGPDLFECDAQGLRLDQLGGHVAVDALGALLRQEGDVLLGRVLVVEDARNDGAYLILLVEDDEAEALG
jgi:hypothetical protein